MGNGTVQRISDVTAFALYFAIVAAGTYDLLVSWYIGVDATISRVVWMVSSEYPVLAFVAGVVIGHLLWPQRVPTK